MPKTFLGFPEPLMYPDNWSIAEEPTDETEAPRPANGLMLESPDGGFVDIRSVDRLDDEAIDEYFQEVLSDLEENYGEVERDNGIAVPEPLEAVIVEQTEFRFYYLDLLILSRVIIIGDDDGEGPRYVFHAQAESRRFDENEQLLQALMIQLARCVEQANE
ncbi:MAG: hypothetical protein AAF664_04015 [Planctomycetota bacterium]